MSKIWKNLESKPWVKLLVDVAPLFSKGCSNCNGKGTIDTEWGKITCPVCR